MTPVPTPSMSNVKTNGDLVNYIISLLDALDNANLKLSKIKQWCNDAQTE